MLCLLLLHGPARPPVWDHLLGIDDVGIDDVGIDDMGCLMDGWRALDVLV